MRLQINPPVVNEFIPGDTVEFTAKADPPPPAMWDAVTNNGDIASDFSLNVDGAGSSTRGDGAHQLQTGIGIVEWTIDDFMRPTGGGFFVFTGRAFDVSAFEYNYRVEISAGAITTRDEAGVQLFTTSYSTVSGDIYRLEMSGAGFRLYRNGTLLDDRLTPAEITTALIYPMSYRGEIIETTASNPSLVRPPRLIGNWKLGPVVDWTAPAHGSLSTTGQSLKTKYSGGTIPGTYTLTGRIEAGADAENVQLATATITIPPLQPLGNLTEITLQPVEKKRFKTNYDKNALVAWSVILGGGSFTQGEYTAAALAGTSLVRATAAVNGSAANITVTVPPVITNANNYTAAKASEVINFTVNIPLKPSFVSVGTVAEGTGAIIPGLPPGILKDDLMWLIVETASQSVSTPSGWAIPDDAPQETGAAGGATSTRLSVFWKRVGVVPANETAPTVSDSGDHQIARIVAFRDCIATGNPWDDTAGTTAASSTSVSIPGGTTTVANCLVMAIVSNATDSATAQTSTYANADLTSLAEIADSNTTQGNGGGFGVVTGEKASIGTYGATTATLANASVQALWSVSMKPAVTTWTSSIGSINSSTGQWTAPSLAGQTAVITATNGTLTVSLEVDILEVFPFAPSAPNNWELKKTVLVSRAEDRSRTSRVKDKDGRPFQPWEVALENLEVDESDTLDEFWEDHHPQKKFIFENSLKSVRQVMYFDSDIAYEADSGCAIRAVLRMIEA